MSYAVRTSIKELDIRIPKEHALKALAPGVALTHEGLEITGQEGGFVLVKEKKEGYHITLELFGGLLVDGEALEELAIKFNGTYKAIDVGEDGEVFPVSIVDGKAKNVSISIEED